MHQFKLQLFEHIPVIVLPAPSLILVSTSIPGLVALILCRVRHPRWIKNVNFYNRTNQPVVSSAYSRNSWPYKNIVISCFRQFFECSPGCWVSGAHGGGGGGVSEGGSGLSVKRTGWTEGSTVKGCPSQCWLQPPRAVFSGCWGFWSSQRSPRGPSSSPRCLPSWSAVGRKNRSISVTTTQRLNVPPPECLKWKQPSALVKCGHLLTCSTVLSLKPKPSFSRQVMYVMSMQRKGLMARYLVILLHTANRNGSRCPESGFWHKHHTTESHEKQKNTLSKQRVMWLKDDHSDVWARRCEELRVNARLWVGGGVK